MIKFHAIKLFTALHCLSSVHNMYHPDSVNSSHALRSTFNSVSLMSEKARSGMLADVSKRDIIVKESDEIIRQKITVQTTTEEGLVPLPVSH